MRELKSRLSEYLRLVRKGELILITDRGEVVAAELRQPGALAPGEVPYPKLVELATEGRARLGAPNRPELYPRLKPVLPEGMADRAASTRNEASAERLR